MFQAQSQQECVSLCRVTLYCNTTSSSKRICVVFICVPPCLRKMYLIALLKCSCWQLDTCILLKGYQIHSQQQCQDYIMFCGVSNEPRQRRAGHEAPNHTRYLMEAKVSVGQEGSQTGHENNMGSLLFVLAFLQIKEMTILSDSTYNPRITCASRTWRSMIDETPHC